MLNPLFKVRLCNFQLDAPIASARAQPPYLLRGRFDDRAFNTKGFSSASMRPTWDDDISFEYVSPSVEQLTSRYLMIECYGGEAFLGACRVSLYNVATGPTGFQLELKDGMRDVGRLNFHCSMELISDVAIQLSRVVVDQLPRLGYDDAPNPYLSYSLTNAGDVKESSVAAGARIPEWSALPPVYFKGTYLQLCAQRLSFTLKHSRNAFSVSYNDITMSAFSIPFDKFPIDSKSVSIPFRERIHSEVGFPFPFSGEIRGVLEFRNVHQVVQLAAGVRTDNGVTGGVSSFGPRSSSPPRSQDLPAVIRTTSPPRRGAPAAQPNVSFVSPPPPPTQISSYVPPSQAASSMMHSTSAAMNVPMPAVAPVDLEVLEEVTSKQSALLSKVEGRLQEISRRKNEVTSQIASQKVNEETELEAASQRKLQLDNDLRNALLEKDRLEEHLRSIQLRREEESRIAVQQAAERERAKRALEEEQQEALVMQQRVVQLRNEMTRHLEEEERRYQQRVREAEEARRRTMEDTNALADLEARLAEAELRATVRQKEEQSRTVRRSQLSSPPRQR